MDDVLVGRYWLRKVKALMLSVAVALAALAPAAPAVASPAPQTGKTIRSVTVTTRSNPVATAAGRKVG